MVIRMPIDIKSLYLNIKNDNQSGHTPTVATPLRQGSSIHNEIAQILSIDESISAASKDELALMILSKSKTLAKIVKAYTFNRISVNGIPVDTEHAYCIYIREETDKENFHYGRQKVHYPQILKYEDEEISIDNRSVIKSVSAVLHDYAFVVQAFEYDTDSHILNFDALIVGYNGIPYSKVFVNKRGVGTKFSLAFKEYADNYDTEVIALRNKLGYEEVRPDNFIEIMEQNRVTAMTMVTDYLHLMENSAVRIISSMYPYSLFDIECISEQRKRYVIVRFTSTKIQYFTFSHKTRRFINEFPELVDIYVVTDINGNPSLHHFTAEDLQGSKKTIATVTYEVRRI